MCSNKPAHYDGVSPVYGFLKNPSLVDYPGELAGVFFVSGCNFHCGFCHNHELAVPGKEGVSWEDLANTCRGFQRDWVSGVVISGGEPTLSPQLPELIAFFKTFGFKVKLDTNGSRPEVLRDLLSKVDYVAMDLKCALEDYPQLTGFAWPERIAESIALLKQGRTRYELRTTIIEDFHTDEQLQKMLPVLCGTTRYRIQPFLPREDLPEERYRSLKRTSPERLRAIKALLDGRVCEILV